MEGGGTKTIPFLSKAVNDTSINFIRIMYLIKMTRNTSSLNSFSIQLADFAFYTYMLSSIWISKVSWKWHYESNRYIPFIRLSVRLYSWFIQGIDSNESVRHSFGALI